MAPFFRLHNTKCVIFIDFWRMFQKNFLKIVFFAKNAYYKNGANTNFVLFHTVKLVWKWRQIMNSCLKCPQMRVKRLYLKWRHFLLDIMQNIYFHWFLDDFHQKMLKIEFFSTNVQRKNCAIKPFTKFKPEKMSANVAETCVFPPSMFNCDLNQYNRNGAIFSVWLLNFKQKNSKKLRQFDEKWRHLCIWKVLYA